MRCKVFISTDKASARRPATPIPRFSLVAHGQDEHDLASLCIGLDAVQRDIAGGSARDYEFAQIRFDRAADQRVVPQDGHRLGDQVHGFECDCRIGFDQKIGQALKVVQGPVGIDYFCQGFAFGLETALPDARSRR